MRKTLIAHIGILLTLVVVNSCKKGVEPEETDYHNKILFTSSRSGKAQLYMMNPDGTNIQQITSGEYSHSGGRWSPDASKIVCSTDENTNTADYSMMEIFNADGTNKKLLGYGSQMAWSPDGKKILFTRCLNCELGGRDIGLFVIDSNGENVTRLPVDLGAPDWAPDGKTIALVGFDSVDSHSPLNVIIKIIDYPSYENLKIVGPYGAVEPVYSPNGKEIAFSSIKGGYVVHGEPTENIFIMDADGTNIKMITDLRTGEQCSTPRWAPIGDEIIFLKHSTDGIPKHILCSIKKEELSVIRIIDDTTVISEDWSK